MDLPGISIVVPNFQGGKTLEHTLRSLVDQQYPNLEIIVVDGGSTDESLDIIRRFEPHIAWWVSEKDNGQSNAINKGFAHCQGEIVNWLCSDDYLMPGALQIVGNTFAKRPDIDIVVGECEQVWPATGQRIRIKIKPDWIDLMPCWDPIPQPSCFFRRRLLDRPQPIDERYYFSMDFELWCYFQSRKAKFLIVDELLSIIQNSATNKTSIGGEARIPEWDRLYRTYAQERIPLIFWHRHFRYPVERFRQKHRQSKFIFYSTRLYTGLFRVFFGLFYGQRRVQTMNWEWFLRPPA
jgi:glycosyltransferase involved in cell wall biosynthesis